MTDAEAISFASQLRWRGDNFRMTQAPEEILWLVDVVRAERPRIVVEIGTDQGGTLFLWPYAAADDALIVAVDIRPLGTLGRWAPYAVVRRALALRRQRVDLVMGVDSHDARTVVRVRLILDGRQIDFWFIDADHSYDGVKRDFELFSPLVRAGGIVAFHDVSAGAWPGVVQFFGELRKQYEGDSHVAAGARKYGVGYIRLPQ
jgi:cephalosporin hydroxylase